MTIYRNDNKMRKEQTSDWLDGFAKYWKEAEGRIKRDMKRGSYMSEIQKAMDRRSMDDVIGDLKERTGLNIIEKMKKESDNEVNKKASFQDDTTIPQKLREFPNGEEVLNMIEQTPGKGLAAIWSDFGWNEIFSDPEVKEFLQQKIKERGGKEERPKESINYDVDTVDATDNREVFNDRKDGFNTI